MRGMIRLFVTLMMWMSLFPAIFHAQATSTADFEVATIKLSKESSQASSGIRTGSGQLSAKNVTLRRCIIGAYGNGPHQIVGGPGWIDTTRFDIEARADRSIDSDDALMQMLQRLLADRFGLKLHREQKSMRAYSLEVAKDGTKLPKPETGEAVTNSSSSNTMKSLDAHHVSMNLLAKVLARETTLPIVNNTGLDGDYTFQLRWTPDSARLPDSSAEDYGSLPDAVREQLGLQLRTSILPVEALIIDEVSKPTED